MVVAVGCGITWLLLRQAFVGVVTAHAVNAQSNGRVLIRSGSPWIGPGPNKPRALQVSSGQVHHGRVRPRKVRARQISPSQVGRVRLGQLTNPGHLLLAAPPLLTAPLVPGVHTLLEDRCVLVVRHGSTPEVLRRTMLLWLMISAFSSAISAHVGHSSAPLYRYQ